MEKYELPLGFGMALSQNPVAVQKFAMLSDEKKRKIIDGTHSISSRSEMRAYVERIVKEY